MALERMELAALRRMEGSLSPLKKKINILNKNISKMQEEKGALEAQISKMEEMMDEFAKGSYKEVLHPEIIEKVENEDQESTLSGNQWVNTQI